MLDRVDGIDRGQQASRVKNMENRESRSTGREKEILEKTELKESLDKNELSADELRDELENEIEDMNNIMDSIEENLTFKLHDETEKLMVQVIDMKTDEVLKEMPPEEMLDLAAKIHKMVGIIIDEEV